MVEASHADLDDDAPRHRRAAVSPRKNPGGRRPGDSGTKAAILQAARDQFAAKGYQATTMRGIASQAAVDPALIRHFYGSKDDLFAATLDIPDWFGSHVDGVLAGDPSSLGLRYVNAFLSLWEAPDTGASAKAILLSATTSDRAAELLQDFLTVRVFRKLFRGIGSDHPETRVALASSHLLGVAIARFIVRMEPLASMDRATLVAMLAPTTQQFLTGPLPNTPVARKTTRRKRV
jgi:AcrR family transcriptional regulator